MSYPPSVLHFAHVAADAALVPGLFDAGRLPRVGEIYGGRLVTVAMHRRWMVESLICNEEASGDPELVRVAAMRRRWAGLTPRAAAAGAGGRAQLRTPAPAAAGQVLGHSIRAELLTREFWLQRSLFSAIKN